MVDVSTGILIFLLILILIKPALKFFVFIWEFNLQLCPFITVDIREKYGDWAVITGSTDGIGKEYAKELAKRNINIILISRTLKKLNNTKDEIHAINPAIDIKIIQADFSKGRDEINTIKSQIQDISVGILVNNVGVLTEYPMYFDETPENDLWNIININIATATLMTHIVIPQMKKRGKGAIINVSSASNLSPLPLMSVYGASKAYLQYFSEAIRAEYTNNGITVQCLSPYFIRTKMVQFSSKVQLISCDPSTYAKSAIDTLGKVDSTTGYWMHEIIKYVSSLFPLFIKIKIALFLGKIARNDYLKSQILNLNQ